MSEHPFDELERIGAEPVPPVDPGFADRLESNLRIHHGALHRTPVTPWKRRLALGLAAGGLVVTGLFGASQLGSDDDGVPVEVTGPIADRDLASDPPAVGDRSDDRAGASGDGSGAGDRIEAGDRPDSGAVFEPTPTPTATPSPAAESDDGPPPPAVDRDEPATDSAPEPTGAPAVDADADPTPAGDEVAGPTATPTATPTRPPAVRPEPTPSPARPTPGLRPTPAPTTVVPTPLPSPTATPVPLTAACRIRTQGDAFGVVCEWQLPIGVDVARFTVQRSRNGAARELVAAVAPPRTQTIDRDIRPGDTLVYVVTGLTGDAVRAVSERMVVQVPLG